MNIKKFPAIILAAIATPVFAQSSVTLYGIVDSGFNYTNNAKGSAAYQLASGYVNGSRWGLRGNEDLGGGTAAIFQLENGFNLSTGALQQQGRMFGRQAYVGISNKTWGKVTLGRQYDEIVDNFFSVTGTAWGGYLFTTPYDNDNTDNSIRFNNTIKYTSPIIAGLRLGATYSFSNDANFSNDRGYSLGAQYTISGLVLTAAYLQANNPGGTTVGTIESNAANFTSNKLRIFGAGASYTTGPFFFGFAYTNSSVIQPTSAASTYVSAIIAPNGATLNALKFQNFAVNGRYQVTPAFSIGGQYVFTMLNFESSSGISRPKYHSVGILADYFLSKRTDLYFQGAYQFVANGHTGTVLDNAFVPGAAGLSSTNKQVVLRVAIKHNF